MRKNLIILLLGCSLLWAQTDLLQEEQDFRFAGQLAAKGMHDLASLQFQKYADDYSSSPRAPEALFQAAKAYELLKEANRALDTYLQLVLKYPQSSFVDKAMFNRASLLAAAGRPVDAALSFERLRLFAPKSELAPLALITAGQSFLQAGDDTRALDAAFAYLEQYPTDPLRFEARYLIAQVRFRQHKPVLALQELDRILGERVEDGMAIKANYLRGRTLYDMGRYHRADSLFQILISSSVMHDSIGSAGLYFSRLLHYRGDYQMSNQTIKTLLEKHAGVKEKTELILLQGDNHYALGEFQASLNCYASLDEASSGSAKSGIMLRQALTLQKLKRDQSALQKFQNIFEIPDSSMNGLSMRRYALLESSRLLCTLGHPADALLLLRRSMNQRDQQTDQILFNIATIQKNFFKDNIAATSAFTTLLELYPTSSLQDEALYGLAQSQESQGRFESALYHYQNYLVKFPAGDQVPNVASRIYYLQHFKPVDAERMQVQLQEFIAGQWSGADRTHLALSWAEKLMHTFHDHQQALTVLRSLPEDALTDALKDRLKILNGHCHLALADKARYEEQPEARKAHLDSLQQILAVLQVGEAAASLQNQLFLTRLQDFSEPQQRIDFINSAPAQVAMQTMSDSLQAIIGYNLASSYYQAGNDTSKLFLLKSLQICQSLKNQSWPPQLRADVFFLQASLYRSLLKSDSSVLVLQQLLQTPPNHSLAVQALWQLAEIHSQKGRWTEALQIYQDLQHQFPYSALSVKAERRACQMLYKLGKFSDAQKCLNDALALRFNQEMALFFPTIMDDDLLWFFAQTQESAGSPLDALKAYRDYLLKSPKGRYRPAALLRMAELSTNLGYDQAGVGHYQELLDQYPQDSLATTVRRRIADHYYQSQNYAEADKNYLLLKTVADVEMQRFAATRQVLCEFKLGNYARAKTLMDIFKKQYTDRRSEAQFMIAEAEIYLTAKEFKIAETLFKDVASKYKETPEASQGDLGLARLYIILNKNEEALKILTSIPDKYSDPKTMGTAFVTLAEFYYANRQFDNCIAAGRKAYELKEAPVEKAQAMQLLIRVYDDVRMWDRAIALLREYLQTYPNAEDFVARKVQLGIFLINMKEYERAIVYLKELKWLVDAETEAEVQYWIAKSYNDRGSAQEAIIEYLKVKYLCKPTKLPWGTTALYEAGQAYYKLGELSKARSLFQSIVQELGAADQFGRVAADRVQEIDTELAQIGKKS